MFEFVLSFVFLLAVAGAVFTLGLGRRPEPKSVQPEWRSRYRLAKRTGTHSAAEMSFTADLLAFVTLKPVSTRGEQRIAMLCLALGLACYALLALHALQPFSTGPSIRDHLQIDSTSSQMSSSQDRLAVQELPTQEITQALEGIQAVLEQQSTPVFNSSQAESETGYFWLLFLAVLAVFTLAGVLLLRSPPAPDPWMLWSQRTLSWATALSAAFGAALAFVEFNERFLGWGREVELEQLQISEAQARIAQIQRDGLRPFSIRSLTLSDDVARDSTLFGRGHPVYHVEYQVSAPDVLTELGTRQLEALSGLLHACAAGGRRVQASVYGYASGHDFSGPQYVSNHDNMLLANARAANLVMRLNSARPESEGDVIVRTTPWRNYNQMIAALPVFDIDAEGGVIEGTARFTQSVYVRVSDFGLCQSGLWLESGVDAP